MSTPNTTGSSKPLIWTGRILTTLTTLFMLMDGVMKLVKPEPVMKATLNLGFPESTISGIGIALLVCTLLYVLPRTAVLGAMLLTGYLGGAVAAQVRIGAPVFDTLFPVIFAVLIWAGIYLREARLRALVPWRGKW